MTTCFGRCRRCCKLGAVSFELKLELLLLYRIWFFNRMLLLLLGVCEGNFLITIVFVIVLPFRTIVVVVVVVPLITVELVVERGEEEIVSPSAADGLDCVFFFLLDFLDDGVTGGTCVSSTIVFTPPTTEVIVFVVALGCCVRVATFDNGDFVESVI